MKHARGRRLANKAGQFLDTVVIVPARNEERDIFLSLESLAVQTTPPSMIVVVVNNSTDRTLEYARAFSQRPGTPRTYLVNLPSNPHKKAGALNAGVKFTQWALRRRLADVAKYLLVLDADSELHPEFIARARRVMEKDRTLGGVSAACQGRREPSKSPWMRLITGMQKIEYGRYSVSRIRQNVHTMSGAGSFYRTEALQDLLDSRNQIFWEHENNLVEDYETTLALKEAGWRATANENCIAYTDLMSTLDALVTQRERWVRGTVDILRQRGWTKHTWHSILMIILGLIGFAYMFVWIGVAVTKFAEHGMPGKWYYLILMFTWTTYQCLCVRHLGWRAVLVEALIIPELLFNLVRTYWLVTSVIKSYSSRAAAWVE